MKEEKETPADSSYKSRIRLGILIIAPAFILIAFMVYMQYSTSIETMETLKTLVNEDNPQKITAVADVFDNVNASNQSFFNILLAVFAAWVGAVVAFYFGSENLQQAQQTLKQVLSAKQELAKKTIGELLTELKEAKNVRMSKIDDTISKVRKELQTMSNVLVINDKGAPLGVLYRVDLEKYVGINIDDDKKGTKDDIELSEVIGEIKSDYITMKPWSKEGVPNYASLRLDNNLFQAKEMMEEIAGSVDHLLSVRGIVMDKGNVIAIINFANLTKVIV